MTETAQFKGYLQFTAAMFTMITTVCTMERSIIGKHHSLQAKNLKKKTFKRLSIFKTCHLNQFKSESKQQMFHV